MSLPPPPSLAAPATQEEGRFSQPQADHPAAQSMPELSTEEMGILRECQSESFWYRSLPLSGLLAASAHLAVSRGILKPSPTYGARPKVVLGLIVGYFAGKFSYADACAEKFIRQAPHSNLAESIRKRRGLPLLHPEREQEREAALQQQQLFGGQEVQGNNGGPALQQLREQQSAYERARMENRAVPDPGFQVGPPGEPLSGYEEMRRQNRGGAPPPPPPPPSQGLYQPLELPPAPPAASRGGSGGSNKYGDEGFE